MSPTGQTSYNGWTVYLTEEEALKHLMWWKIPRSTVVLRAHKGAAGFVMANLASWFNDRIEPLQPGFDDWCWAPRPNTSDPTQWSNHASATALDCNALLHPYGRQDTFSARTALRIRNHMAWAGGVIKWGGDYHSTKDEMHFEIDVPDHATVRDLAAKMLKTVRGQQVMTLNEWTPPASALD